MDQCVSWEKEGDFSILAHYQHEKKKELIKANQEIIHCLGQLLTVITK